MITHIIIWLPNYSAMQSHYISFCMIMLYITSYGVYIIMFPIMTNLIKVIKLSKPNIHSRWLCVKQKFLGIQPFKCQKCKQQNLHLQNLKKKCFTNAISCWEIKDQNANSVQMWWLIWFYAIQNLNAYINKLFSQLWYQMATCIRSSIEKFQGFSPVT